MQILVLDTIHGGILIGDALRAAGHQVDLIDVYRGSLSCQGAISPEQAAVRRYDLLVHPAHLDPAYPLLRAFPCPAITHHEAVRWILGNLKDTRSQPWIEITGTRGKTTTASALAHVLSGAGILHTSRGVIRYPEQENLTRMSITPASLLKVQSMTSGNEWMIGEVSLGFTGIADLSILTSDEDYPVANARLSAWNIKKMSGLRCTRVLIAPGVQYSHDHCIDAGDLTLVSGSTCSYAYLEKGGSFENPLLLLEGYRIPLQTAAAAALILGYRPDSLASFSPLDGRMKITREGDKIIIDNASTGTCLKTTRDAISIIHAQGSRESYSLVIGQGCRAVCENFPAKDISTIIREEMPAAVMLVAGDDRLDRYEIIRQCQE